MREFCGGIDQGEEGDHKPSRRPILETLPIKLLGMIHMGNAGIKILTKIIRTNTYDN